MFKIVHRDIIQKMYLTSKNVINAVITVILALILISTAQVARLLFIYKEVFVNQIAMMAILNKL